MLHPEIRGDGPCMKCGTVNNIVWYAPNQYWNATMPNDGVLCVTCYADHVHAQGQHPIAWALIPEHKCINCDRPFWAVLPTQDRCNHCLLATVHK